MLDAKRLPVDGLQQRRLSELAGSKRFCWCSLVRRGSCIHCVRRTRHMQICRLTTSQWTRRIGRAGHWFARSAVAALLILSFVQFAERSVAIVLQMCARSKSLA